MAKKSMVEKCKRVNARIENRRNILLNECKESGEKWNKVKGRMKFSSRAYTRCNNCGRPHAVYKKFGICRICFRKMALEGYLPGVKKASW